MRTAKRPLIVILLICILILGWSIAARQIPTHAQDTLTRYERFETSFTVPGDYSNPYDAAQVDVSATFTAPSGRTVQVPAFYMQPYADVCENDCLAEVLEPQGEGEWHVRFAPDEVGAWRYTVNATIADESAVVDNGRFDVTTGTNPGYVRIADNGRYFDFDDGASYFPIGQNLGWSWEDGGGIYTYLRWLDQLETAGANYARIYIDVPWFIGLEWTPPLGQYGEAGQQAAWRFDQIVEAAESHGIYLQVVLIWNQAFREYAGVPVNVPTSPPRPNISSDFDNHPYNVRQGGGLQGPGEIFFSSTAQDWLKQRLRYVAARWGYSTHIFAWEMVDALDRMAAFSAERDTEWLSGMIETLQEYDVNNHLITVGTLNFQETVQQNPLLDFSQTRVYQARPIEPTSDQVTLTLATLSETLSLVPRPVLLTEFSINPWFEPTDDDPTGVHIQNTMWATVLSGAAGGAMPWWWDTYIDPQDLYHFYTPLRFFTEGVPWNALNLHSIEPGLVAATPIRYEPLRLDDFNRQFRSASPPDVIYRITADGATPPITRMSSYLYGRRFNAANSRPQTFIITPPVDTTLTIAIRNTSTEADAQLVVTIDGITAALLDLSANTDATNFQIPLTAGQHTVVLDNLGDDWLQLEYLEIADYRAPLRTLALADESAGVALVWIHHRDYTWDQVRSEATIIPLDFRLDVSDMPIGDYRVEFWDTHTGNIIGEERMRLVDDSDHTLRIQLLPIDSQLALRIFRIAAPEGTLEMPTLAPTRTPSISQTPSVLPTATAPQSSPTPTIAITIPAPGGDPIGGPQP